MLPHSNKGDMQVGIIISYAFDMTTDLTGFNSVAFEVLC